MLKLNYQSVRLYTSYAKKQGDIFKKLKYRWLKKSCYNIFKVYSTLIQLDNTWETVKSLSRVRLFVTPRTVAYHAPPSMGYSRQEYWSGLPFPSPGDLPDPGIEPRSPALQADTLTSEPPGKPIETIIFALSKLCYFVNSAAMNIEVHVYFQVIFSLNVCPAVGLLDNMVTLFFVCLLLVVFFKNLHTILLGLPWWLRRSRVCLQCRRPGFDP